jgi:hypothetical protein
MDCSVTLANDTLTEVSDCTHKNPKAEEAQ